MKPILFRAVRAGFNDADRPWMVVSVFMFYSSTWNVCSFAGNELSSTAAWYALNASKIAVSPACSFIKLRTNFAFFGEKDYQQLAVIRQFVHDLNMPLEVMGVAIARAEDGLALSSRNGYLSEENRQKAPIIYQSLKAAEQSLQAGTALADVLANIKATLTQAGFVVDYVEARTPALQKLDAFDQDVVLFVAAKLGATRLIDNLKVKHI
jgi:pantoate--beta-alanine ligase